MKESAFFILETFAVRLGDVQKIERVVVSTAETKEKAVALSHARMDLVRKLRNRKDGKKLVLHCLKLWERQEKRKAKRAEKKKEPHLW